MVVLLVGIVAGPDSQPDWPSFRGQVKVPPGPKVQGVGQVALVGPRRRARDIRDRDTELFRAALGDVEEDVRALGGGRARPSHDYYQRSCTGSVLSDPAMTTRWSPAASYVILQATIVVSPRREGTGGRPRRRRIVEGASAIGNLDVEKAGALTGGNLELAK
jgi:hypothetical protein